MGYAQDDPDMVESRACRTKGVQHDPKDCPAYSRCCRRCGIKGHLGRACPTDAQSDESYIEHLRKGADHAISMPDHNELDKDTATLPEAVSTIDPIGRDLIQSPKSQ